MESFNLQCLIINKRLVINHAFSHSFLCCLFFGVTSISSRLWYDFLKFTIISARFFPIPVRPPKPKTRRIINNKIINSKSPNPNILKSLFPQVIFQCRLWDEEHILNPFYFYKKYYYFFFLCRELSLNFLCLCFLILALLFFTTLPNLITPFH
jgi:hypothetical protein